ncbi:MAG TPA: ABC transporter substrate-binding protein [Xanthobacteraceae bacterium]|nr:ABC transporter substrate-binding protein [Xanthobacteraceae bacterium]
MHRRAFLKSVAGAGALAAGGLPTPAISQRAAARAVRLVPHADLANFDPVWTTAYIARNAGLLVWDTLYGVDARLKVQRQMVEAEEVSADGLVWTFRLRPGLKFHDGEPVLAQDAVASVSRWAARDPMGQMLKAIENELAAVDDRTFRWALKKPFPKLLLALGKISTPCCFVMPARVAATDPFKQIAEYVGSGPMPFERGDWVPGARSAFEKFADYVPRQEDPSWLAGGKRIVADRIEWIVMPDASTAAAALQTGEIDWCELVVPDLVPMLRQNRNLAVDVNDPLGSVGMLVMNQLFAPFNDARARRAILMAMSQQEYMHAYVGDDANLWKPMPGYLTPGSPLYNEEGGDILKGPRKRDAARRLLAESGYAGEPVTCMASQDLPHHKAWGDVTVDLLKQLGVNVDFAAVDWGTVVARRTQKNPPGKGGWHMYHTAVYGVDCVNPSGTFLRANGSVVVNGWAESAAVEAQTAAWFAATALDEEKTAARAFNAAALDHVLFAPLGWYLRHYAWRRSLAGVTQGPMPFFWGVSKTV